MRGRKKELKVVAERQKGRIVFLLKCAPPFVTFFVSDVISLGKLSDST